MTGGNSSADDDHLRFADEVMVASSVHNQQARHLAQWLEKLTKAVFFFFHYFTNIYIPKGTSTCESIEGL